MDTLIGLGRMVLLLFRALAAVVWVVDVVRLAASAIGSMGRRLGLIGGVVEADPAPNALAVSPDAPQARIDAMVGDLSLAPTEAIVSPAAVDLSMGKGIGADIRRAAGEEVEREAMALGPIETGQAVATAAGRLRAPIRWVVHAAANALDGRTSEETVRAATASALAKAVQIGARSIALPPLGTGTDGLPMADVARVMADEARRSAATEMSLEWIVFVLPDKDAWRTFLDELADGRPVSPMVDNLPVPIVPIVPTALPEPVGSPMATIESIVGDLCLAPTEAIVNPANTDLSMGEGVAASIRRAGGESLEHEAMALGPIDAGQAVATSAGQLRAPITWVIHAATNSRHGPATEASVRAATASALALAAEIGATSVALPPMGTGADGLPTAVAARVMAEEASKAAGADTSLDWIVLVLPDEDARQVFQHELDRSAAG